VGDLVLYLRNGEKGRRAGASNGVRARDMVVGRSENERGSVRFKGYSLPTPGGERMRE